MLPKFSGKATTRNKTKNANQCAHALAACGRDAKVLPGNRYFIFVFVALAASVILITRLCFSVIGVRSMMNPGWGHAGHVQP